MGRVWRLRIRAARRVLLVEPHSFCHAFAMSILRASVTLLLLAASFALVGCIDDLFPEPGTPEEPYSGTPRPPVEEPRTDTLTVFPDFGEAYDASKEEPPLILSQTLRAVVRYGGGCNEHTFTLDYREEDGGGMLMWLHHDVTDGPDPCDAYIRAEVAAPLPEPLRSATPLRFVTPDSTLYVFRE
jgi:hypothetical protein